jgi:hypothetical protein
MLRLETNAGAIDENVITQVTAKVGGVVAHGQSMAHFQGEMQMMGIFFLFSVHAVRPQVSE